MVPVLASVSKMVVEYLRRMGNSLPTRLTFFPRGQTSCPSCQALSVDFEIYQRQLVVLSQVAELRSRVSALEAIPKRQLK